MSGIESYFDNLDDEYLHSNLVLNRARSGDYYIESVIDNITRPSSHPSFNEGPLPTPALEQSFEAQIALRRPKNRLQSEHPHQRHMKNVAAAKDRSGQFTSRRYDNADDVLADSFSAQKYQHRRYQGGRSVFDRM